MIRLPHAVAGAGGAMAGADGEPALAMASLATALPDLSQGLPPSPLPGPLPGLRASPAAGSRLADSFSGRAAGPRLALGDARLDAALGGGLLLPACHDLHGGGALAFALMLALACPRPGPILWVGDGRGGGGDGQLYADGIAALGGNPGRLILVAAPDATAMLRAGAEVQRCAGVAVLVLACAGNPRVLDLTASRRLALGAAAHGVFTLVLRKGGSGPAAAVPPSAAATRWQVQPAPSQRIAGAPGVPRLALHLARQRGGPAGLDAVLAWDAATRQLRAADAAPAAQPAAQPATPPSLPARAGPASIHPIGAAFAARALPTTPPATAPEPQDAPHIGPAPALAARRTPSCNPARNAA